MVQFNFSERTIKAKVVYYGPPQSGKTTNLEQIHRLTDPEGTNRLISLNTAQDRTLFFDLLPFSLGSVSGYDFKIQLYTVPGQVQYNATRRVVLAGADAVVFVADSQKTMARENVSAFENMKVNLLANRLVPEKVPLVLQYNKQDLPSLIPGGELDRDLNPWGRKAFPAIASRGDGVLDTFVAVVQEMLGSIAVKYNLKEKGLDPAAVPNVVNQAFDALLRNVPAPSSAPARTVGPSVPGPGGPASAATAASPRADAPALRSPARVVIAQPQGVEAAYPGQAGSESSPVSEELLHRAIRSNVELAEVLASVIREVHVGLGAILTHTERLLTPGGDGARTGALAGSIRREAARLQRVLQQLGQAAARAGAPPRVAGPKGPPAPPAPSAAAPPGTAVPAGGAASARLDTLLADAVGMAQRSLGPRRLTVQSRVGPEASLPRCSPADLQRAIVPLLRGLGAAVSPGSAISLRAERKPVLLRGRDGRELRRDFVMLAFTHGTGLDDAHQQRILKGADPGPIGEAYRSVRQMGGFMRFAPLPGDALETRLFLPA